MQTIGENCGLKMPSMANITAPAPIRKRIKKNLSMSLDTGTFANLVMMLEQEQSSNMDDDDEMHANDDERFRGANSRIDSDKNISASPVQGYDDVKNTHPDRTLDCHNETSAPRDRFLANKHSASDLPGSSCGPGSASHVGASKSCAPDLSPTSTNACAEAHQHHDLDATCAPSASQPLHDTATFEEPHMKTCEEPHIDVHNDNNDSNNEAASILTVNAGRSQSFPFASESFSNSSSNLMHAISTASSVPAAVFSSRRERSPSIGLVQRSKNLPTSPSLSFDSELPMKSLVSLILIYIYIYIYIYICMHE
jgi:hypothetical protein